METWIAILDFSVEMMVNVMLNYVLFQTMIVKQDYTAGLMVAVMNWINFIRTATVPVFVLR